MDIANVRRQLFEGAVDRGEKLKVCLLKNGHNSLSTDFRIFSIAVLGSGFSALGYLNTPEPETMTFAPALEHTSIVSTLTPPSTWIFKSGNSFLNKATYFKIIHFFRFARRNEKKEKKSTLGIMSPINFWPPKPGSTVIIKTISKSFLFSLMNCSAGEGLSPAMATSVLGLIANPTFILFSFMLCITLLGSFVASK